MIRSDNVVFSPVEAAEFRSSEIPFNPIMKTPDFKKQTVTDLRNNPPVTLPLSRPQKEEEHLQLQVKLWTKPIQNYADKNYHENGQQKTQHLTNQQNIRSMKLKTRAIAGEIVIFETDNSNKTTISSMESYKIQGEPPVNDKTQ